MGVISHSSPQEFAEELRAYLWAHIDPLGADKSGRWLESATGKARSRDYWRKVTNGDQAMTTNDVQVIAERIFEQSPYEFIRAVREWNSPSATIHYPEFTREPIDELAVASDRDTDPNNSDEHF